MQTNTNIFEELDDYLVKEKGIRYVTAFRDNTNYINAAKKGIGIFEMGESMTAQDREEWKPLLSWVRSKRRGNLILHAIQNSIVHIFILYDVREDFIHQ